PGNVPIETAGQHVIAADVGDAHLGPFARGRHRAGIELRLRDAQERTKAGIGRRRLAAQDSEEENGNTKTPRRQEMFSNSLGSARRRTHLGTVYEMEAFPDRSLASWRLGVFPSEPELEHQNIT